MGQHGAMEVHALVKKSGAVWVARLRYFAAVPAPLLPTPRQTARHAAMDWTLEPTVPRSMGLVTTRRFAILPVTWSYYGRWLLVGACYAVRSGGLTEVKRKLLRLLLVVGD